jgi:hypothetical protein
VRTTDLTTLANVKSWLNVNGVGDDGLLSRLIASQSRYIQAWIGRELIPATKREVRDGTGTPVIMLGESPVLSVSSVSVSGVVIQLSADGISAGYTYDPMAVYLIGYSFAMARQNVIINYSYGYQVNQEAVVVPATPFSLPVASLSRPWSADVSVVYASSVPLTRITTGVPTTGQYLLVNTSGVWSYQFAAGDTGSQIAITYGYTPEEIEQAAIELVSLRYRERSRIGENSKSIGGETVSFNVKDFPDSVKTILENYKRVVSMY